MLRGQHFPLGKRILGRKPFAGWIPLLKSFGYCCHRYGTGPLVPTGHSEQHPPAVLLLFASVLEDGFLQGVNLCIAAVVQREAKEMG